MLSSPRRTRTALLVAAALIASGLTLVGQLALASTAEKPLPFEDPKMVVVYSGPDRDAQLLISVGNTVTMASLALASPTGAVVTEASFDSTLGQADFRLDTPEPSLGTLKRTYPAGVYRWTGRTVDGRPIVGVSRLSYRLLTPPRILAPARNQKLTTSEATLEWGRVAGAHVIHLEVEQVRTSHLLTVDLPGSATRFTIPDGFLQPGLKYTLDVKAVGPNDNLTVTDVDFRT